MHHQLQTLDSPSAITFSTERPQMLVPRSFIAQNAPIESSRCTIRIPWYHQNPAYTHRILFALTAWLGDQWDVGPMRWGAIEMGDQWVGGTNEMGDQWNGWCMVLIGGPMRWGTDELGDQWEGEPMRWGTNEMGDHWDWPMMGWLIKGGGAMRWGTNDMGDQWDGGPMSSNNVLGDQWEGDQ